MDGMQFAAGRVALAAIALVGVSFAGNGWNTVSLAVLTVVAGVSLALAVRSFVGAPQMKRAA